METTNFAMIDLMSPADTKMGLVGVADAVDDAKIARALLAVVD